MFASEVPVKELTQDELVRSIQSDSRRAADPLRRINYEHAKLDAEHAILSPEDADILSRAAAIVKKIRDTVPSVFDKSTTPVSREGLGPDGGR